MAMDLDPRLQHKHDQQPHKSTHRNTAEKKAEMFSNALNHQVPRSFFTDQLKVAVLYVAILFLPFISNIEFLSVSI